MRSEAVSGNRGPAREHSRTELAGRSAQHLTHHAGLEDDGSMVKMRLICLVVLCFLPAVPWCQTPSLGAGAIVNGASFAKPTHPNGALSPGAIVSAFGANLASSTQVALTVPLSTSINGSWLSFFAGAQEFPAPLFFVSSGQINAQIPFTVPLNAAITAQVTFNGQKSAAQPVTVTAAAPGIFNIGGGAGAILHNSDFTIISASNPAKRGAFIDIFCTGLGAASPPAASGAAGPSSPPSNTALTAQVTLAGQQTNVVFSGLAPGFVGLYQVAFQVPANAPTGTQNVILTVNGVSSNVVTTVISQ